MEILREDVERRGNHTRTGRSSETGEGGVIHRGTRCLRRLVGRLDLGGVGLSQRALLGRHYVGDG